VEKFIKKSIRSFKLRLINGSADLKREFVKSRQIPFEPEEMDTAKLEDEATKNNY